MREQYVHGKLSRLSKCVKLVGSIAVGLVNKLGVVLMKRFLFGTSWE